MNKRERERPRAQEVPGLLENHKFALLLEQNIGLISLEVEKMKNEIKDHRGTYIGLSYAIFNLLRERECKCQNKGKRESSL